MKRNVRISVGPLLAVLAVAGCDGGSMADPPDAGPAMDDGSSSSADAGTPGADGGPAANDGGAPDPDAGMPGSLETPGGEPGTAPIVGCEDADRPARALETATEPACEAVAGGQCWYVHPGGDDAAEGTFAAPFRRPQVAVRHAGPGDVIYLRGGVYGPDHSYATGARRWDDPDAGLRRDAIRVGRVSVPDWGGGESWHVASGTEEAPIVVRSFPGERACLDGAGSVSVGSLSQETAYWRIEDLTLRGAGMHVGGGTRGDDGSPANQTHHITLQRNEVFEHQGNERDNTGLVKVNRGDFGGPYEIHIVSNILHDLYVVEDGVRRDWTETRDAPHFGGVTTLSCETYFGVDCGGNGRIVIDNNHIYDVPSSLFFKNPAEGPFEVRNNVFHHSRYLGLWSPANIRFENNLVHDVGGGIQSGAFGGSVMDPIVDIAGQNLELVNNTFVGLSTLVTFRVSASGHTIRGNVIEGLSDSMSSTSWDTRGYIARHQIYDGLPDSGGDDPTGSELAIDNDFGGNCLVTGTSDFIAASRFRRVGDSWDTAWWDLEDARALFGMETDSVVEADPSAVFVGFDGGDYAVRGEGPCAGMGASR